MEKSKIEKIKKFLIDLDEKIKQMKEYLAMEMGSPLLEAIDIFERENKDTLQNIPQAEKELDKRKRIIQCLLFPILSDNEVKEILEHHLLEPLEVGLDLDELMKMRSLSTSELIWPKLSQEYLNALLQNGQLLGGESLIMQGKKDTFLPYLKNWISLYNYRFGVEKHEGLEPHQFILEDFNAKKLSPSDKESLLKILKFYESLKVFSLSEIETEMKKVPLNAYAGNIEKKNIPPTKTNNLIKAPLVKKMVSPLKNDKTTEKLLITKNLLKKIDQEKLSLENKKNINSNQNSQAQKIPEKQSPTKPKVASEFFFQDISTGDRIKFVGQKYEKNPKPLVTEEKLEKLFEKYPFIKSQRITLNNIRQAESPMGSLPSLENWINYYFLKTKKENHTFEERKIFIKNLKENQNLSDSDLTKLENLFLILDEKKLVSFDQNNRKILLDFKLNETSSSEDNKKVTENDQKKKESVPEIKASNSVGEQKEKRKLDLDIELVSKNKT